MTRTHPILLGAAALLAVGPLRADETGPGAQVTAVSVVATPGHAEVVIAVKGTAEVRDFVLKNPDRLVVDLVGATLPRTGAAYDGVQRGGIKDVRYAQFRPDVVRVAIYLAGASDYRLERTADGLRVRLGTDQSFAAWSSVAPADLPPPAAPRPTPAATRGAPAGEESLPEVNLVAVSPNLQLARTTTMAPPRITVAWDNATIGDVIAGFSTFSGRTIVMGKNVKGTVTAEIRNQPWTEAFAAVLAAQGLQAIEMRGGIIRVDDPAVLAAMDSIEPVTTRMVPINYASAGQLVGSVKAVLTKRGTVVSDTTTNSLIVTETRSRVADVEDFIRTLDVRTPQVSIQSKIIFIDRTNLEQLGLKYDIGADWAGNGPFFNRLVQRVDPGSTSGEFFEPEVVTVSGNGMAAMANAEQTVAGAAVNLLWTTMVGGFRFTSFLEALQSVELADIQAEPSITTVDNREATIVVGEEIPVRVVDAGTGGGGGGGPQATVEFKETGIMLKVTPHVTNNRQVLLQVEAERSNLRLLAASDLGYTIQKQSAGTQLLVNDGETAVIGGLTVTSVTRSRTGIPLLVNLPVIGNLFGYSLTREQRQDLIILVTPRVLDPGD